MPDTPWLDDACSLVDAFRAGERSPVEELEATLAAIEASELNAFSHLDPDRAREAARTADVSLPFGGVPTGIKELEPVAGWPDTGGSLVFKDRIADHNSHHIDRLFAGGVVPVGLTTSSEFGGLNVSVTRLNGVTRNPWRHDKTCGGSSAGSASAVAGGLVSLACGGDGGGSLRIPAGYTGMLGFKGTFGRITRGPRALTRPNTVVLGNIARSVRDAARYYDVCAGLDPLDPSSLPSVGRWEADLGSHDLKGRKVAIVPTFSGVKLESGVEELIRTQGEALAKATGMELVDVKLDPPLLSAQWAMGNLVTLLEELGDKWPGCAKDMTHEISAGMFLSQAFYNLHVAAEAERRRVASNVEIGRAFEQVDFIVAATNPGPAFDAEATTSSMTEEPLDKLLATPVGRMLARSTLAGGRVLGGVNPRLPGWLLEQGSKQSPDMTTMGALTILANIYGNPSVSIPAGTVDDLPVGMQVMARHHEDALLFDVALAAERTNPWPRVAPPVTRAAATTG